MRLADHVTLNFNNTTSTAAVFLDVEKAFDTTRHSGLLYIISELEFTTSLVKLIAFLTDRKSIVLVEGEISTPRNIAGGVPQGSIFAATLHNVYKYVAPAAPATHLAPVADDTCIYTTEKHECLVLCKLQRGLTAVNSLCESCNIKINERKLRQSISISISDDVIQLSRRDIPSVNHVAYLDAT
jgi:hypothetical protein